MVHYPITLIENKQAGKFVIRQALSLDDPDDYIEITLSVDQTLQIGARMLKFTGRTKADLVEGPCEHFEAFWFAYPAGRRVDKTGCLKIWKKNRLDDIAADIVNHVRKMCMHESWLKDGGQFVPMSKTYLNQSRWETDAQDSGGIQGVLV